MGTQNLTAGTVRAKGREAQKLQLGGGDADNTTRLLEKHKDLGAAVKMEPNGNWDQWVASSKKMETKSGKKEDSAWSHFQILQK